MSRRGGAVAIMAIVADMALKAFAITTGASGIGWVVAICASCLVTLAVMFAAAGIIKVPAFYNRTISK